MLSNVLNLPVSPPRPWLGSHSRACLLDVVFVHSLRRYSSQRRFLARRRALHTNFDGLLLHILGLSARISGLLPDKSR